MIITIINKVSCAIIIINIYEEKLSMKGREHNYLQNYTLIKFMLGNGEYHE